MPAGWMLCALLAQAAAQASQDITDVERVRKTDASPTALSSAVRQEGMVFRVTIRATVPDKPPWEDWSHVPSRELEQFLACRADSSKPGC